MVVSKSGVKLYLTCFQVHQHCCKGTKNNPHKQELSQSFLRNWDNSLGQLIWDIYMDIYMDISTLVICQP